ncbi:MAG: DNA mismatch repair endonuclease MutL, partial [Bacteroidetes bacterium]
MPETLANKIAAGEVVQRPASALKELIENALDAGADAIDVVLKKAGSELIQVIDNGCGMGPADAVACFQRHATSKITSIEDLERIRTLGFRGEALASIAAVAQVELRTRRVEDEAGTCVRIHGGTLVDTQPCAAPGGTSLAVRNLFFNVPARRNFLKTPATEFRHLVETFQFLALSNPDVGFTLTHDDNEVYRLTPSRAAAGHEALRHRILELFGESYRDALVPVEETTSYLSVYGFVGTPEFHRKSRGEQFLFVNRRYVKNRYLEHAVASGFGDMLPEGAFPFFTLFLDLDPRHVDVNVHPTKAEVKFDDERGIYGFIKAVVKKALGTADLTPRFEAGPEGRSFAATLHTGGTPASSAPPAPEPRRPAGASSPVPSFPDSPFRVGPGRGGSRDDGRGWQMSLGTSAGSPARLTGIPAGTLSGRLYGDTPTPLAAPTEATDGPPEAAEGPDVQGVPSVMNQVGRQEWEGP